MPGVALLHRVRHFAGVDRAVFYSVVTRAISTVGNLVTIPLILTRLTPVEQGFYYTFGSVIALQVFLEMGFGAVAIQMVAHEAAHLKIDLKSGITGPTAHLARFSATIRFIRKWFLLLSLLAGMLLFPTGYWFFASTPAAPAASWFGPWSIMVLGAAGMMFTNSLYSTIEGMGFVAESIRVRLWGNAAQLLFTIAGLLIGLRLYSAPTGVLLGLVVNAGFIWRVMHNVIRETAGVGTEIRIDWFKEVFPFQWRIALSWISGWFIFSAMLPVVFREFGPAEAGRFGMAMSLSTFISGLAASWSYTKSAIWGQMVSRREWQSMDSLFWKVMPQSVGIAFFGSALVLLVLPHLAEWVPRFSGRVPDWRMLLFLCSVAVMNQAVFAEAFYLRAHKREPFLASSVLGGTAMAIGLFGVSHGSALSICAMYAGLTFLGGLVWGSLVFARCRSRWHQREAQTSSNT